MKVPCSFYRDSEALSGDLEHGGNHPPNLTQADFFLLPKEKNTVQRRRFHDIEHIKDNMTARLNTVPLGMLSDTFVCTFRNF
jgi:hypothetical protein